MKYELRTLRSEDVFPMLRIISKIGIKEFKGCFESEEIKKLAAGGEANKEELMSVVGMTVAVDLASVIISHLPDAELDIYRFLAGVSGMKEKEIRNLDMATFFEMIVDIIKKDEFKDFFKVVSKLFNSMT